MSNTILEANGLVKKFGDFVAVKDVSFTMEEGEVFGLLGSNGAGKSTTISMLTCLYPPSGGEMRIFGHDVVKSADKVKKLIGVVPQDIALYPTLNAIDNLRFFGEMYGLKGKELKERVETVIAYVAMQERAKDAIKKYSGGMKRRGHSARGRDRGPGIPGSGLPAFSQHPGASAAVPDAIDRCPDAHPRSRRLRLLIPAVVECGHSGNEPTDLGGVPASETRGGTGDAAEPCTGEHGGTHGERRLQPGRHGGADQFAAGRQSDYHPERGHGNDPGEDRPVQ